MTNCDHIVDLISKGGEEGAREGIRLLYEEPELRRISRYFFGRYPGLSRLLSWEDLLYETIVRIVTEIRAGRGPRSNCRAYLRNVCRNICEEYRREHERTDKVVHALTYMYSTPGNQVLREKVEACLRRMGGQCEVLLWWHYFAEPPLTEHPALAKKLGDYQYQVSPGSISTLLTRCRRKFSDLLAGDPSSLFDD